VAYCSVECQRDHWTAGHCVSCSIQLPLRQLVLTGSLPTKGVLRLLNDDEIWTYLMADSKADASKRLTWYNIDKTVSDALEAFGGFWEKRCRRTNPSWTLERHGDRLKWFRQWCILHEANREAEGRILGWAVTSFVVKNSNIWTWRDVFEFLGRKAKNLSLAMEIFEQIHVDPDDTTFEVSLPTDADRWRSPVLHTLPSDRRYYLGGKLVQDDYWELEFDPDTDDVRWNAKPEEFDVLALTPEKRMLYLLLGWVQTASLTGPTQITYVGSAETDNRAYELCQDLRDGYLRYFMKD
jgi:hypothetical protein